MAAEVLQSSAKLVPVRLTDYYPFHKGLTAEQRRMEGGVHDRRGRMLYPLEDYLEGNAPYVSLACDFKGGPPGNRPEFKLYGYKVQIPFIAHKYGKSFIEFRLVDTGGHFFGPGKRVKVTGFEPIDVCRRQKPEGRDRIGGTLTSLLLMGK